jgi:hypothetical protein
MAERRRAHSDELSLIEEGDGLAGGRTVGVLGGDGGDQATRPSKQKPRRVRNPAPPKDKELVKLDKLFLRAWKRTHENRGRRLD